MEPEQFGTSAEISYPAPPLLQITGTVDTMGSLNPDEISRQIAKGSAEQTP